MKTSLPLVVLVLIATTACTSRKTALQRATDDGYALGTSDSIKRQYWLKQALEKAKGHAGQGSTRTFYYSFDGATETKDGRKLVDHKVTVPVQE